MLLTGKGSEEIASKAISAGVSDYHQNGGESDQFVLLANRIEMLVSHARAQDRLEAVERELVFWKEFAPAAIVVEPTGEILAASVTSRELFDANQLDTLLGMDIRELVHPEDREEIVAIMSRVKEERDELTCKNRTLVSLDDEVMETTVQWRPINHWGQDALLAVMNDFPPATTEMTAPP